MSTVIDLTAWRRRREAGDGSGLIAVDLSQDLPEHPTDDPSVVRLEQAIDRLHDLVSLALDGRGRLQPRVETELLAIMGELTVGLVKEAATRAERLADRLAAVKGGRST